MSMTNSISRQDCLYLYSRISKMLYGFSDQAHGATGLDNVARWFPVNVLANEQRKYDLLTGDWANGSLEIKHGRKFKFNGQDAYKRTTFTLNAPVFSLEVDWNHDPATSENDYISFGDPADVNFGGNMADFETWRTLARLAAPAGLARYI